MLTSLILVAILFVAGCASPAHAAAAETAQARPKASKPSVALSIAWPVKGPVTSRFGASEKRSHHSGIDIAGDIGDPIHAAADGRVLRIADHVHYGLLVVIEHDGGYATWYGHASALEVRKGDTVTRGQVIAHVGETGNARGIHLHFEVRRNGRPVDPLPFLKPAVPVPASQRSQTPKERTR